MLRLLLAFAASISLVPAVLAQVPILDAVRIDSVFADFGTTTPGCALGIYQRGRVVYAKGYGMADLNLGVPIGPETMFDIGSTSKQFAAASILLLAQDGRIALTDPVRKYVPELPSYADDPITIDHMLRHISGLRDYNGLLFLAGHAEEDFTTDDDALDLIGRQRNLNFLPGTRWDYSNTGFFLLSVIIKRVTGRTLAEFARDRIFVPLGMTRTHFRDNHAALLPGRAVGYSPGPDGYLIEMSNWDPTGDGAVNTNVLELARWDANFYSPTVGGAELVARLTERGRLNRGDSLSYARGLFVDRYRGLSRVHHGGAWAGYRAMLMRFPDQGVAIGLECNVADANTQGRAERVADVILGPALEPAAATGTAAGAGMAVSAADQARLPGVFFAPELQSVMEVVPGDSGGLSLRGFGGTRPLAPAGPGRFTAAGGLVEVRFSDDAASLTVTVLGDATGPYRRVVPPRPGAAALAALAGSYPSPELNTTWTIAADSGRVYLESRALGRVPLEPVVPDGFRAENGFLMITRKAGRIDGFEFSASRMMRIRFDRRR
ncbi:MAG: serine hydrolase domain-containing protein [Gemmatimonadales bacterium]